MRRWIVILMGLALAGCAGSPRPDYDRDNPPDRTPDGLVRVENAILDLVYVREGVDFSRFDRIQFTPIPFSYKELTLGAINDEYRLTTEQKALLRRLFFDAVREAMTHDGRYSVTDGSGPRTLTLRVAMAEVEITVPPVPVGTTGDVRVTGKAGATVVVELLDSVTGETLARGRDRNEVRTNQAELRESAREVFRHWASLLRQGLDTLASPEGQAP